MLDGYIGEIVLYERLEALDIGAFYGFGHETLLASMLLYNEI
jgi:hypothetical protein